MEESGIDAPEVRWKPMLMLGGVLGVVVCGALLLLAPSDERRRRPSDSEFATYVEKLRAAGIPTTLREAYGPEPPDADNAAPEIAAVYAQIQKEFGDESTWCGPGTYEWCSVDGLRNAPPERIDALRAFFPRLDSAIARIDAALDRPRCRFPLIVGADGSPTLDHLRVVFRVELILFIDAGLATDPERCVERCRTALRFARRNEPLGLGDVVPSAATAEAVASALRKRVSNGDVDLATARRRLDPWLAGSWLRTMADEFPREIAHYVSVTEATPLPANFPRKERLKLDGGSIAWCDAVKSLCALPLVPCAAFRRQALVTLRSMESEDSEKVFGPGFESVFRDEAACRLCRVALAVAEHRATAGDFPASLDDLKPLFPDGVPLDPYTDAPFVYSKTAAGVRIASVGRLPEDPPLHDATLRERCLVWELKR